MIVLFNAMAIKYDIILTTDIVFLEEDAATLREGGQR